MNSKRKIKRSIEQFHENYGDEIWRMKKKLLLEILDMNNHEYKTQQWSTPKKFCEIRKNKEALRHFKSRV